MGSLKVIISPRQFSNPALGANKWRFDSPKCPLVEINNAWCHGGQTDVVILTSAAAAWGNKRARDGEKKKGGIIARWHSAGDM